MVATLTLLLSVLVPVVDGQPVPQAELPQRVAALPAAAPVSAADLAFEAESEDLRKVLLSFERARVDASFIITERLPRFIELAQQGSGRAAAFALFHFPSVPGELRRERTEKLELYRALERSYAGQPWLIERDLDVFTSLRRDAVLLGVPRARGLARALRSGAQSGLLRAKSHMAEAWIELDESRTNLPARRRAHALLREVIDLFPGTPSAREAGEALWRLNHLSTGDVAPDFVGTDVDGNELRLSDWNRRVVVVDFWSLEDPDAEARLEARRALYERFREERFAIVGINLDRQETAYRRAVEELGIEWQNVFTGGTDERVIWKIRGPATFVLAPERVIRFVDLGEDQLDKAVLKLIEEGKEHGGAGTSGSGPPIR